MSKNYAWQKPYNQAVLESDPAKQQQLIWQAEDAIQSRLHNSTELSIDEAVAIERTSNALSAMGTERIASQNKVLAASH
jgi:hypothetical protein